MAANYREFSKELKDFINLQNESLEAERQYYSSLSNRLSLSSKISLKETERESLQNIINEREKKFQEYINDAKSKGLAINRNIYNQHNKALDIEKQQLSEVEKQIGKLKRKNDIIKGINVSLKNTLTSVISIGNSLNGMLLDSLMVNDKAIRNMTQTLSMTGDRAAELRKNFEVAAVPIAQMGGSLNDAYIIQKAFADETGRSRLYTSQQLQDIFAIGRATMIGTEGASQLVAQFDIMGVNATSVSEKMLGIMETSERMGVNTTNVMKNISTNFKKLQSTTFTNGVDGFAKMAMYAEKFKINMSNVLDSADKMRTLEQSLSASARLQVLGSGFGTADPFQLLNMSRNAPEEFQKKIQEMTRGVATLRRMSDGTYQSYISPMDIDRLSQASEALGLQKDEMIQIARRTAEIEKLRTQIMGKGLTKSQQETLEGMYKFDSNSGKFYANINGAAVSISNITGSQLDALKQEKIELDQRAERALTFTEQWKALTDSLKVALLPVVSGLTVVINAIAPTMKTFAEILSSAPKWLYIAAGVFMGSVYLFNSVINGPLGKLYNALSGGGGKGKAPSQSRDKKGRFMSKGTAGAASAGTSATGLLSGIGVGIGAVGVGTGIMLAANGMEKLVNAVSKLTVEQGEVVKSLGWSLTVISSVGMLAGAAIAIFGKAAGASAYGLGVFSLAAMAVGASIAAVSYGIAEINKSQALKFTAKAEFLKQANAVGSELNKMGNSITKESVWIFSDLIDKMAGKSTAIGIVGNSFAKIGAVMNGNVEQFNSIKDTINSINSAGASRNNVFSDLLRVLSKPIKVQFDNKEVNILNNVSLNVDGKVLATTVTKNVKRIQNGGNNS